MAHLDWNSPPQDIVGRLRDIFETEKTWCRVGPRLRFLSKCWKDAVDASGQHVALDKLTTPYYKKAVRNAFKEHKKITSLHAMPSTRGLFDLRRLGQDASLSSLREVRVTKVCNGDVVLAGMLPLATVLQKMELGYVRLSQDGLNSVPQFTQLLELHLLKIAAARTNSLDYGVLEGVGRLRRLALCHCPGCLDFEFLSRLEALEAFHFMTEEGEVQNCSWISALHKLKSLSFSSKDLKSEQLEFLSELKDLETLRVTAAVKHMPWFPELPNLKKLVQCTSQIIIQSTTRQLLLQPGHYKHPPVLDLFDHWDTPYPILSVYEKRLHSQGFFEELNSLDLSGSYLGARSMRKVTRLKGLRELYLHNIQPGWACDCQDHQFVAECPHLAAFGSLSFCSLEKLTMRWSAPMVEMFARMRVPVLHHLGIWCTENYAPFRFSALNVLHSVEEISFGVTEGVNMTHFWIEVAPILDSCKSIKRIGWKSLFYKTATVEQNVMKHLEGKGVLFDQDISIFFHSYADS